MSVPCGLPFSGGMCSGNDPGSWCESCQHLNRSYAQNGPTTFTVEHEVRGVKTKYMGVPERTMTIIKRVSEHGPNCIFIWWMLEWTARSKS